MGYLSAVDMVDQAGQERALAWHLQCNHYPPVPPAMIRPAREAIKACANLKGDKLIDLPDGIAYRDGRTEVEAYLIAESLHLNAFIEAEEAKQG